MIEMIPDLPDNVVGFVAKGEVTSTDYKDRLDPAIEAALKAHDKIRLLYVLGDDFTGYTGGAMWEDGVIGTRHAMRWERIAVVTGTDWVRHTVGVFGFLVPGMVKVFDLGEEAAARAWVTT